MRLATDADKERIVEIISEAYDSNPSVNWIIKNDSKRKQRIRALAEYSFETGLSLNGVFISSDENGAAICFKQNTQRNTFQDFLCQIKLVIKAIGVERIPEALKRENYVKKMHPSSGEFLNFWFFGVFPGKHGGNAAKELKDYIFHLSEELNLPIYVETTIEKNRRVYERYGFTVFHTWSVKNRSIKLYFLKREPQQKDD